ncbi:MurR/RpiR family transcriptional regulator (plasmid) [Roseomonas mucosa]|uniref:MurR/RpiR family transcriptional regulator n=1 Tax=Roseomonas mucosa TaxID=207340 RepID=UPI0030CE26F8
MPSNRNVPKRRAATNEARQNGTSGSPTLEARIYASYEGLSSTEKRLADILLQFQMELPNRTAGELVHKAQVSHATATRLIRRLGYESYAAAKRQIAAEQNWGSPLSGLAKAQPFLPSRAAIRQTVQADLENIRTTVESIPEALLGEITRCIAEARILRIMGLRSGYGLAHHAAHYFSLVKRDVQVLPVGGASFSHEIASIAKGDVLLVIAFRRRPRLLPVILQEARAAGAVTVLMTDLSAAASARVAQYVLRCHCHSPSPFNSFTAAVTLINYLAWSVSAALGEESRDRFATIDRLVGLLDDVSTPARVSPRR